VTDLSIAIPDSFVIDSQSLLDKSMKISQLARACSIFRVRNIFIYNDRSTRCEPEDRKIIKTILEYLDAPPYTRRQLFPQLWMLKYAGMLPPIKSPHHKPKVSLQNIEKGDVRVGVIFKKGGVWFVDVGIDKPIRYSGTTSGNKMVTVKLISKHPQLSAVEINKQSLGGYWGYTVIFPSTLKGLLDSRKSNDTLLTSVEGRFLTDKICSSFLTDQVKSIKDLMIVFGSPKNGLKKILAAEKIEISDFPFVINMFPDQGTQTVRVEEAILGTLAIINQYTSR
jgi:predicted SPOUT superfamily RNA methylase MTH1